MSIRDLQALLCAIQEKNKKSSSSLFSSSPIVRGGSSGAAARSALAASPFFLSPTFARDAEVEKILSRHVLQEPSL